MCGSHVPKSRMLNANFVLIGDNLVRCVNARYITSSIGHCLSHVHLFCDLLTLHGAVWQSFRVPTVKLSQST